MCPRALPVLAALGLASCARLANRNQSRPRVLVSLDGENVAPERDAYQAFLLTYGRRLRKRIPWTQGTDYAVDFEVALPGVPDGCTVTGFLSLDQDVMNMHMYATGTLKKLLSTDPPLKQDDPYDADNSSGKLWHHAMVEARCAEIVFDGEGFAWLEDLGTTEAEPYGGCGCMFNDWMLIDFFEALTCKFGLEHLYLEDLARVTCEANPDISTPAMLIHTVETGRSWYQSLGYTYFDNFTAGEIDNIRHTSYREFRWPERLPAEILQKYEDYLGGRTTVRIKDFAMWVWQNHCEYWDTVANELYLFIPARSQRATMGKHLQCDDA